MEFVDNIALSSQIEHIPSMVTANDARYGRKILNDLPYLGRMVACIAERLYIR